MEKPWANGSAPMCSAGKLWSQPPKSRRTSSPPGLVHRLSWVSIPGGHALIGVQASSNTAWNELQPTCVSVAASKTPCWRAAHRILRKVGQLACIGCAACWDCKLKSPAKKHSPRCCTPSRSMKPVPHAPGRTPCSRPFRSIGASCVPDVSRARAPNH